MKQHCLVCAAAVSSFMLFLCFFYPGDAVLARVFATATCPSVRPSVRLSQPVLCLAERKQDREMYTL